MLKLFRYMKWQRLIHRSGLFDARFYLFLYSDVRAAGIDPIEHYVKYGASEGRNPSDQFDTSFYLKQYDDVQSSGVNPLVQYILQGREEGRFKNNDELSSRIIRDSKLFDEEYYLSAYPSVKEAGIDPIEHYVKYGASEGRNPSGQFDTSVYHTQDSDVNPLVQYILQGGEDGRTKDEEDCFKDNDEHSLLIIRDSKLFDEDYYLSHYLDVARSSIKPLDHFCATGWKENRNPNELFDTEFYLKANPDVKQSGLNPFYHYLQAGRNEGRITVHPAGYKRKILENAMSPGDMVKNWDCKLPDVSEKVELSSLFETIRKKPAIISISHDRYIDHIGGVQVCISDEQLALKLDGYSYINISPACPLPVLSEGDNWHGDVIVDNIFIGTYRSEDILSVFRDTLFDKTLFLVMHAIHGHSEKFLKGLYDAANFEKSFFWLHDYFSVCQNSNLLRNNLIYCSAPDVESQGCRICVTGGENREKHLVKISSIFEHIPFTVIAPSQTALNIWLEKSNLSHVNTVVQAHRNIITENSEAPIKLASDMPLRIAFLGHDALHKGWFVFKELVERFKDDDRYEFFHLGINDHDKSCSATFHEVRNNWKNMKCMQDTIQKYNIHVSFLWSVCPETYNLVMYEALASGSTVLTNKSSGNIAAEVEALKQGMVLNSEEVLFEKFRTGNIRDEIERIFSGKMTYGSLQSSNMTASFISLGEEL